MTQIAQRTVDPVRPRERDAIIAALRAGLVPATGLQNLVVGRGPEMEVLATDLDAVARGGARCRAVVGPNGAGKTFLLAVVWRAALAKNLVAARVDLTPSQRLHSTGGHAQALYRSITAGLATRVRPEGGALAAVLERVVSAVVAKAADEGRGPDRALREHLASLAELPGGYDFTMAVEGYWRGHDSGDDHLKAQALRWLRGEFTSKTDARDALGIRTIVDDGNWYDCLKLVGRLCRLAGHDGLVVLLDEAAVLHRIASPQARAANYERVLGIWNDTLQGGAGGLGFVFGITPEALMDPRRGWHSYPALRSRLVENPFARDGLLDYSGPVIRLAPLSREDLVVLLENVRRVYASGDPSAHLVPDEAILAFVRHSEDRFGEACFRNPRTTVKAFCDLLSILEQYPDASWQEVLDRVEVPEAAPHTEVGGGDGLAELDI
jgi:hypothetical protein